MISTANEIRVEGIMQAGLAAKGLVRVMPVLFRVMSAEMRCIDPCLLPGHMRLLGHLMEGEYSLSELAERQGVTMATTSNTINALVERGWVSRVVNPEDRRKVTITITESGRQLLKAIHERLELRIAKTLAEFSSDELAVLSKMLEAIQVEVEPDGVQKPCGLQEHLESTHPQGAIRRSPKERA